MIFTPDEASKYLQAIVIHERINSGTNIQDFAMACYRLKSRAETAERELAELRDKQNAIEEITDARFEYSNGHLGTVEMIADAFNRLDLAHDELAKLKEQTQSVCYWRETGEDSWNPWEGDCGVKWNLGLTLGMKYCPSCGRKLVLAPTLPQETE